MSTQIWWMESSTPADPISHARFEGKRNMERLGLTLRGPTGLDR